MLHTLDARVQHDAPVDAGPAVLEGAIAAGGQQAAARPPEVVGAGFAVQLALRVDGCGVRRALVKRVAGTVALRRCRTGCCTRTSAAMQIHVMRRYYM